MEITHVGVHESVAAIFPPETLRDELASIDPKVSVVREGDDLAPYDALVTFEFHERFLDADFEWIQSIQAGVDRFPSDALESRGIVLTNATGVHRESVGESALGMMLMLARRLGTFAANQSSHIWKRPEWDEPFTLDGESLCVVGLGALGRGIAERARSLGMHVTGVRRSGKSVEHVREVFTPDALHDAIADATFVALAVPLNDETHHLFGPAEFEAMREDSYLVNVARGPVVDEDALAAAIEGGDIAGAALDVFETEPLPGDSPLWEMDDVVITPHAAGADRDYYRDIAALVRENVQHIDADEEPTNRMV